MPQLDTYTQRVALRAALSILNESRLELQLQPNVNPNAAEKVLNIGDYLFRRWESGMDLTEGHHTC